MSFFPIENCDFWMLFFLPEEITQMLAPWCWHVYQHLPEQNHPVMQVHIQLMEHMGNLILRRTYPFICRIQMIVGRKRTHQSIGDDGCLKKNSKRLDWWWMCNTYMYIYIHIYHGHFYRCGFRKQFLTGRAWELAIHSSFGDPSGWVVTGSFAYWNSRCTWLTYQFTLAV